MTAKDRIAMLEGMIAEEPKDPELRYALAMEFASAENDGEAIRCFETLLEMAPTYAPGYHQLGRTLQRADRVADARSILAKGIPIAQKQGNHHAAGEMADLLQSME